MMRWLLFLAAMLLALPAPASPAPKTRPRVGIALGGGGARGLAHIGVLKVIEEAGLPVDVVTGTSMGSIIGGLYAIGYTPAEIERIVLEAGWQELFRDRLARGELPMKNRKRDDRYLVSFPVTKGRVRLPSGLIGGQRIYDLFVRLAWPVLETDDFRLFPRPFACVATDIETGDAVVFDHGYLPDAMRASMAIPSVFTPVRIGGRLLVDGGLARNLPAEDARALGADIVIGVDVSSDLSPADELESFIDIFTQTLDIALKTDHATQSALCTILFTPRLDGFRSIDYDRAREIIRAGEDAARERFDELRAIADSLDGLPPAWPSPAPVERRPVRVDEIEVRGLRDVAERLVHAELGIHPPQLVTADQLEMAMRRLFSSGYFTGIRYRFDRTPAGRRLVVIVEEESGVTLNAGLRYDSHWRASLLLNATVRNLLEHGSQFDFDLLFGDRSRLTAAYALHTGIRRSAGARVEADWLVDAVDEYRDASLVSRAEVSSGRGGMLIETLFSRILYSAAGLNVEWYDIRPEIAPETAITESGRLAFFSGDLWFDTLDRSSFTRRGVSLRLRGEKTLASLGSEASFGRGYAAARVAVPVHPRVTARADFFLGMAGGENLPSHYRFFVGGVNSCVVLQGDRTTAFYGYRHQELAGENAFMAAVDVQVEPYSGWYITLRANVGNAVDDRSALFNESLVRPGGALSLGVDTHAGPVELSLMYGETTDFGVFFDAGFAY